MGILRTLNKSGDAEVEFSPTDFKEAKDKFRISLKNGNTAFKVTDVNSKQGAKSEQIRKFDPNAEEIHILKPMQGG